MSLPLLRLVFCTACSSAAVCRSCLSVGLETSAPRPAAVSPPVDDDLVSSQTSECRRDGAVHLQALLPTHAPDEPNNERTQHFHVVCQLVSSFVTLTCSTFVQLFFHVLLSRDVNKAGSLKAKAKAKAKSFKAKAKAKSFKAKARSLKAKTKARDQG